MRYSALAHMSKAAPKQPASTLFLRKMPPDVMAGLDEWAADVQAESLGGSGITRTDLVRDILTRLVRGQAVEPRKSAR